MKNKVRLVKAMEKAMATHSSTLAWKIPWMEEPGRLQSMGSLRVRHNWATSLSLFTFMHWRRKCNPLQCSCLENPRDGGAWWAAIYGSHRVGHDWSNLAAATAAIKAIVFPVVMYGCENWTIKKAEHRRIDAFELWCWKRLLRVPWTARGSNQSILKEICPGCSLGGLMLKLKLQYFDHLIWRADLFGKTMRLGKIEGGRRRGQQRMNGWMASPIQWTWVWLVELVMDMSLARGVGDGQGGQACCGSWGHKQSDMTEWLNWTELTSGLRKEGKIQRHIYKRILKGL